MANAHEATDSLFTASLAKRINIEATPQKTTLVVTGIDGTADNYYYQSVANESPKGNVTNTLSYGHISSISIIERADSLQIRFTDADNEPMRLTYPIADPDNRSVNSWTGMRGSDFGINIGQQGKTRYDIVSQGISFGWIATTGAPAGMNPSMGHSHEYSWLNMLAFRLSRGAHSFTAGLGMRFRDIETKGPGYFRKTDNGQIEMQPYSEECTKRSSRIDLFNLQIHMTYGLRYGHKRRGFLEVGPIVNFNTGASIKTKYTVGSQNYSIKTKGISPTPVTVDLYLAVGWSSIGLYVRYAPMHVLRSRAGMDFGTFSTGITLAY